MRESNLLLDNAKDLGDKYKKDNNLLELKQEFYMIKN